MDTFFYLINNLDLGLIIISLGAATLSASILLLFFDKKKNKNKKTSIEDKVFDILDEKFNSGMIKAKSDIEIILESLTRKYDEYLLISIVLEDYLTFRFNLTDNDKESSVKLERLELIKKIIEEENEERPFGDLPDEERRVLVGINDAVKNKDMDTIKFNLNELHSVISTRNEVYEKTNRINKWSIPLAIAGTFFTIFFGLLSFFPNNNFKKLEESNKIILESIQNIDANKIDSIK